MQTSLDSAKPQLFGKKPWQRFAGCLGGTALVVLGIVLIFGYGKGIKSPRGIGVTIVLGLTFLGTSFSIQGAELQTTGLLFWKYTCWLIGRKRFVPKDDIETFELGEDTGKFTVTAVFKDGTDFKIPQNFSAVKDAQAVIDFATSNYGASAGVAIENEALLAEAAAFSSAARCVITPQKPSRAAGERLRIVEDSDDNANGEIRLLLGWFQGKRGEIADGPGNLEKNGPRWTVKKAGKRMVVTDGSAQCQDVCIVVNFLQTLRGMYWKDNTDIYWSAVFSTESDKRTPFTLKMYRGVAPELKARKEVIPFIDQCGDPEFVAIADGDAASFTLDVANADAWPWIRLSLAAAWLHWRPQFSFKKT